MKPTRSALIGILVAIAVLAPRASGVTPVPVRVGPTLRYVTFNLLHGGIFSELTGDSAALEERLRLIVDHLRALEPDVVGLQESSTGRRRGHVAARLAAALGYHYVYAPAATRPFGSEQVRRVVASALGFTEGPAILSRFPIVDWTAYELPRCGRPFDVRVLLFVELLTPVGRLTTFSTHTSGDPCQARAVADVVRSRRGPLPAVVMGDFNAVESSPAIRVLTRRAGFRDAFRLANPAAPGFTEGQELSVPRVTAARRIDYVFLVPGVETPGHVVSSRVVLDQPRRRGEVLWPSDHYGVLAEIAIGDAATPVTAEGGRGPRLWARGRGPDARRRVD